MLDQDTQGQTRPKSHASDIIEDWDTVEGFCERFSNIEEKTLRWQLTMRHKNGLGPYVQVIGKKRYISISGYAQWLQNNAGGA